MRKLALLFSILGLVGYTYAATITKTIPQFDHDYDFLFSVPTYFRGESFTEMIWYQTTSTFGHSIGVLYQENVYTFIIDKMGKISIAYWDIEGDFHIADASSQIGTDGQDVWVHFAIRYDAENSLLDACRDGVTILTIPDVVLPLGIGIHKPIIVFSLEGTEGDIRYFDFKHYKRAVDDADLAVMMTTLNVDVDDQDDLAFFYPCYDTAISIFRDWASPHNLVMGRSFDEGISDRVSTVSPDPMVALDEDVHTLNLITGETVEIELPADLVIADEWTIEFWNYVTIQPSGEAKFLTQPDCTEGVYIALSSSGYFIWYPDWPYDAVKFETSDLANSNWYHFSFINDVRIGTLTIQRYTNTAGYAAPSSFLYSGAHFCEATPIVFNEDTIIPDQFVHDFRIWNKAKTKQEIWTNLKKMVWSRSEKDLVLYFKFSEAVDLEFRDDTGFGSEITTANKYSLAETGDPYRPFEGKVSYSTSSYYNRNRQVTSAATWIVMDQAMYPIVYDSETISFWIRYETTGADHGIICRDDDFTIWRDDADYYEIILKYPVGDITIRSTIAIEVNYWEYLSFTKTLSPLNNNILLGEFEYTELSVATAHADYSANDIGIGGVCTGLIDTSAMSFKEFAYFNHYKSMNELKELRYRTFTPYELGLFRYFKFDEGDLSYVYDLYSEESIDTTETTYEVDQFEFVNPPHKRTQERNFATDPAALQLESDENDLLQLYAPNINIIGDFSLQIVAKISGTRSEDVKFFYNENLFEVTFNTNGYLEIKLYDSDESQAFSERSSATISFSNFRALSITKSAENLKIYLDETLIETMDFEYSIAMNEQTDDYLNIQTGGATLWLREFRVWSRALTEQEVIEDVWAEIYGREYPHSLRVYYKLDESSGTTLFESSYRFDENYQNDYTTDISDLKGLSWDHQMELRLCAGHERKVNQQCFARQRMIQYKPTKYAPSKTADPISLANEYSISFWAYFSPQTSQFTILEKENHITLTIENEGTDLIYKFNGNNGSENKSGNTHILIDKTLFLTTTTFQYNTWRYLSASNSRLLNMAQITVDETVTADETVVVSDEAFEITSSESFSSYLCIGGTCDADTANTFDGLLKEFRVWNKFMGAGAIRSTMHRQLRGDETYLQAYWKLTDSYGLIVEDSSPNGVQLELTALDDTRPPWVLLHDKEAPVICGVEEVYDDVHNACELPMRAMLPALTNDQIDLEFGFSEDDMPRELSYEFWVYVQDIPVAGESVVLQWPGRFAFAMDCDDQQARFVIESADVANEETISVTIEFQKWIQVAFAVSEELQIYSGFIFDYEDQMPFILTEGEVLVDFDELVYAPLSIILPSSSEVYFKEIRVYSQYYYQDPSYMTLEKSVVPSDNSDLIAYWKFDEMIGTTVHDHSMFGKYFTYTDGAAEFTWKFLENLITADHIKCDSQLKLYLNNTCLVDEFEVVYTVNDQTVTCTDLCICVDANGDPCEGNLNGLILNAYSDVQFQVSESGIEGTYTWEIIPETPFEVFDEVYMLISSDHLDESESYLVTCTKTPNIGEGAKIRKDIELYVAEDPEAGVIDCDPSSLEGVGFSTEFTFEADGFSDPEGSSLEYKFTYERIGDDIEIVFQEQSSSNEATIVLPHGNPDQDNRILIRVYAFNYYGGMASVSQYVTVGPAEVADVTTFVSDGLTALSEGTSTQRLQNVALYRSCLTTIAPEYDSNDPCGGCNGHGACDLSNLNCVCDTGYAMAKDCSLSDVEVQNDIAVRNLFFIELESVTESTDNQNSIIENEEDGDLYWSLMESFLQNQNIQTDDLNELAFTSLSRIIDAQATALQATETRRLTDDVLDTSEGLSETALDLAFSSLSHILESESTTLKSQVPDALDKVVLQQMTKYLPGQSTEISKDNYDLQLETIHAIDLFNKTIGNSMGTIQMPGIFLLETTDATIYTLQMTTWKKSPFEDSIPSSFNVLSNVTSVSLHDGTTFTEEAFANLEYDVNVTFYIEQDYQQYFDQTILCAYIDDGTVKTDGVTLPDDGVQYYSRVFSYVSCFTNHFSDFIVLWAPIVVETTETESAMLYFPIIYSLCMLALFLTMGFLDLWALYQNKLNPKQRVQADSDRNLIPLGLDDSTKDQNQSMTVSSPSKKKLLDMPEEGDVEEGVKDPNDNELLQIGEIAYPESPKRGISDFPAPERSMSQEKQKRGDLIGEYEKKNSEFDEEQGENFEEEKKKKGKTPRFGESDEEKEEKGFFDSEDEEEGRGRKKTKKKQSKRALSLKKAQSMQFGSDDEDLSESPKVKRSKSISPKKKNKKKKQDSEEDEAEPKDSGLMISDFDELEENQKTKKPKRKKSKRKSSAKVGLEDSDEDTSPPKRKKSRGGKKKRKAKTEREDSEDDLDFDSEARPKSNSKKKGKAKTERLIDLSDSDDQGPDESPKARKMEREKRKQKRNEDLGQEETKEDRSKIIESQAQNIIHDIKKSFLSHIKGNKMSEEEGEEEKKTKKKKRRITKSKSTRDVVRKAKKPKRKAESDEETANVEAKTKKKKKRLVQRSKTSVSLKPHKKRRNSDSAGSDEEPKISFRKQKSRGSSPQSPKKPVSPKKKEKKPPKPKKPKQPKQPKRPYIKFTFMEIFCSAQIEICWMHTYDCYLTRSARFALLYAKSILMCLIIGVFFNQSSLNYGTDPTSAEVINMILVSLIFPIPILWAIQALLANLYFDTQKKGRKWLSYIFWGGLVLIFIIGLLCVISIKDMGDDHGSDITTEWLLVFLYAHLVDFILLQTSKSMILYLVNRYTNIREYFLLYIAFPGLIRQPIYQ